MKSISLSICIALLFAACTSSKIINSWKGPTAENRSYNRIMVIGIIKESEPAMREKIEKHLTEDLKALGYDAYSSVQEYGLNGFYKMDSTTAYQKLRRDKIDAVLTVVLLDKTKEKILLTRQESIVRPLPDPLWDYNKRMFERIEDKNYYIDATSYFWETNFYDLVKKEKIYTAKTESFEPASLNILAHEYGHAIVNDLVKKKILKAAVKAVDN